MARQNQTWFEIKDKAFMEDKDIYKSVKHFVEQTFPRRY